MRIQHNIMAMNAYRNYSNNTSALSKNLEKLSSGYKINRAGDDAAGLAISEKMRAQITGLEGAQSNAKDGISLVQTAEGALTEVHDMLNRMYSLAEQSANGTYENETDRNQLQKEVTELKSEINRIADSSNFNGINLLDGSLAGAGGTNPSSQFSFAVELDAGSTGVTLADGTATAQVVTATFDDVGANSTKKGDVISVEIGLTDGTSTTINLTIGADNGAFKVGDKELTATAAKATDIKASELAAAVKEVLSKDDAFSGLFAVGGSNADLTLTANKASFETPGVSQISVQVGDVKTTAKSSVTTAGKGEYQTATFAAGNIFTNAATQDAEDFVFTVNGEKFAFASDADAAKALGTDVNVVITTQSNALASEEVADMVNLINQKTGLSITAPTTGTGLTVDLISKPASGVSGSGSTGGLTLQIGDTGADYNQLTVTINDCHTKAMGIDGIDIGTQSGAKAALQTIKDAINYVSDVRGTLGATQNRLDHTINNLSVMQENIQDAESSIRDTDVADEMMDYTKNNILIQSAQAMLAQANQVPQGVLQLLQ